MNHRFLSCDWGTTSFRIRWVEPDLRIVREQRSETGCKTVYEQAQSSGRDRAELFAEFLSKRLREWDGFASEVMPLVISGMASSTVGWRELPYLQGPLNLDGSNLRSEKIHWDAPRWINDTFLISGVAIHPEMMRGEETEAIGIVAELRQSKGTLILPGTHSKHLHLATGQVTAISTFMTGELFDLLATHSLLKASIELTGEPDPSFEEGVLWAARHGLARSLFRVRTRAVLDRSPGRENASFLSGLLIGAELSELPKGEEPIIIGGAGKLAQLYARALTALEFPSRRWKLAVTDRAVVRAHALFLNEHSR
jgi:2-dehydro-3-deoxygalactonokinase